MNILYLVHRAPYPPDKGDRIRSYHLLRYLRTLGNVWLATLADGPMAPESIAELKRQTTRQAIVPLGPARWLHGGTNLLRGRSLSEGIFASRRLRRVLRNWCHEVRFDAAVCFCSSVFASLPRDLLTEAAIVCDFVDVDSEKFRQYAEQTSSLKGHLYWLEAARLRQLERSIGAESDLCLLTTEPEADLYRAIQPEANILAIPNGVRSDYFAVQPRNPQTPPNCVFVGELNYPPNEDAVLWFAKEIWPRIAARQPNSRFRIVGRGPTPAIEALRTIPGVEVVGAVPDVRPFVADATVSVAPLRLARGVQNKVLEAMSMGRAVVSSPDAAAGLSVTPGHQLLVASTADEWEERVTSLLSDPQRADAMGAAGRQYVLNFHVWDHCLSPLGEAIRQISAFKRRESKQSLRHPARSGRAGAVA